MMTKPKAIQWLEDKTGQTIDYKPEPTPQDRHLSVRVSADLASAVEGLANERGQSLSQLVRDMLEDAVSQREAVASLHADDLLDRLVADVEEVRRRLAG
jgi:hypothetical protein